jgi:hypothetical protein
MVIDNSAFTASFEGGSWIEIFARTRLIFVPPDRDPTLRMRYQANECLARNCRNSVALDLNQPLNRRKRRERRGVLFLHG